MLLVCGAHLRAVKLTLRPEILQLPQFTSFTSSTVDAQTIIAENLRTAISVAEVRFFYDILQKIPDDTLYGSAFWSIMIPLACTGSLFDEASRDGYKHLVRFYYSKLCEKTRVPYEEKEFEYSWSEATNQTTHKIELIHYMRRINPQEYASIHTRFIIAKIKELGMFSYYLPDGDLSKILYYCICHKYGTGIDEHRRSSSIVSSPQEWYKFIEPSDEHERGEIYKWKKLTATPDLYTYISHHLSPYFNSLLAEFGSSNMTANKTQNRPTANVRQQEIHKTIRSLNTVATQRNMVSAVQNYLSRQYFFKRMDKEPWILGVANGVLELTSPTIKSNDEYDVVPGRSVTRLIQGYHSYAISRYIPISFRDDPTTYMVRKVATHLHDYFHEKDVVDWHCFFWCRALDAYPKDPIALMWVADGSRAKTFWQQLLLNSMGAYGKKASNRIIMQTQFQSATRTELASLEGVNVATFSETLPTDVLDDQKLKMLLGVEDQSLNDKNEKERMYHFALILWGAMNHRFRVLTSDHGTWRRLRFYSPKYAYVDNPDPNDPLQKKDNPNYVNQYASDPAWQEAFITILLHYHSVMMNKYGGSLKNVPPSPTIEYESLQYRAQQDLIHRYCCERLIVLKDVKAADPYECDLPTFVRQYANWYRTMGFGTIVQISETMDRFRVSAIAPYITDITDNTTTKVKGSSWVVGIRDIGQSYPNREAGKMYVDEEYFIDRINSRYSYKGVADIKGDIELSTVIERAQSEPDKKKKLITFKKINLF
jgi:hypothetical protein